MLRRIVALACACSCVLAVSCRSATQIEVRITTDVPCATVTERRTALYSGDPATKAPYASTGDCTAGSPMNEVGTIVLAPSDGSDVALDVSFVVGVTASSEACVTKGYAGCIRARRRVRFMPHEGLRMPIELGLACLDKVCDPAQTCFRGACISADLVPLNGCLGPECLAAPAAAPPATPDASPIDAAVSDAAADEPELVFQTTATPRGLALDGTDVLYSVPILGSLTSKIGRLTPTNPTRVPETPINGDVFGIAVSSSTVVWALSNAPATCGGSMPRDGNNPTLHPCKYADYVGVGILAPGEYVFAGAQEIVRGNDSVTALARYAEVEGSIVSFATLGGVGVWNTATPATPPESYSVGDGTLMMRGHASAPGHWLVSGENTFDIYAIAKGSRSGKLLSSGQFSAIEDLAWDEPAKTLYVAGATLARGAGIYQLRNLASRFPD